MKSKIFIFLFIIVFFWAAKIFAEIKISKDINIDGFLHYKNISSDFGGDARVISQQNNVKNLMFVDCFGLLVDVFSNQMELDLNGLEKKIKSLVQTRLEQNDICTADSDFVGVRKIKAEKLVKKTTGRDLDGNNDVAKMIYVGEYGGLLSLEIIVDKYEKKYVVSTVSQLSVDGVLPKKPNLAKSIILWRPYETISRVDVVNDFSQIYTIVNQIIDRLIEDYSLRMKMPNSENWIH